jgi:RNA polymerase sigma-32 factor
MQADRTALQAYCRAVKRLPLLTAADELRLARRYRKTGDPRIARRLVEAHLRLVVKIASRYRWSVLGLEDLVEQGNLGLMLAVRRFEPKHGVRLSTYAGWWIRALILRYLLDNHRLVRIGKTTAQRKIAFTLARARRELAEELGRAPDDGELARRLEVPLRAVVQVGTLLDAPETRLDAPSAAQTRLVEPAERQPDHLAENHELRRVVREAATEFSAGLRGRDLELFRRRWLTDEPSTLAAVGEGFGISRERARQIEKRLLDRFREFLASRADLDDVRMAA